MASSYRKNKGTVRVFKDFSDLCAKMNTVKLNYNPKCPRCKKVLNAASSNHTELPEDGDFTVCAYCISPLIFKGKGLYFVTDKDFEEMHPETRQALDEAVEVAKKVREKINENT